MAQIEFEKPLQVHKTAIPGLLLADLPVHGDARGWFKENWQRAKMCALGVPDRRVVQNNISYNASKGVTRGVHAEPWDKWVSVATGSVFAAWVDLRAGSPAFGRVATAVIDPSRAAYVPRGVGNAFQALEDGTAYAYLVDAHWSAELKKTYTFVSLSDPALGIEWPIPLEEAVVSDADRAHPPLADVAPMEPRRTLVTGANGQLGRAVRAEVGRRGLMGFDFRGSDGFDIADPASYEALDWDLYGAVVNCAAYTAVDRAETPEGRRACWRANAQGPAMLARACAEHGLALVHVSSDYVFDGTLEAHGENETPSPLSAYGASKAAGDAAVSCCPGSYILRSSWVVGDGKNFVRTMKALSDRCADPGDGLSEVTVVADQVGRLTFADQMAAAILHLLGYRDGSLLPWRPAPAGAYDLTGEGAPASWHDVARRVFRLANGNEGCVRAVTTREYYAGAKGPVAPRPAFSTLRLGKIEEAGFTPRRWEDELEDYVRAL